MKAERGDISELMTTSFSETRTTEELVPAESEEEKDDEEEEEKAFQNRPYPPRIGIYCTFNYIFYAFFIIIGFVNQLKPQNIKKKNHSGKSCLEITVASP